MKRILIAISVILFLAVILGTIFYWWPKLQEYINTKETIKIKDAEITEKEEYFSNLRTIDSKLNDYSDELGKIDSALPLDPSMPELFNFMKGVSSENGLILEELSLGQGADSITVSGVQEIPFSVSVAGSYSAFKNLLTAVFQNIRMVDVGTISFSTPTEEEGIEGTALPGDVFSFEASLLTYSYSEAVVVAKPSGELEGIEDIEMESQLQFEQDFEEQFNNVTQ